MADAKKCDVCRGFYDKYQSVTIDNGNTFEGCRLRFEINNYHDGGYLDLCSECMRKVHILLSGIAYEADRKEERHE